MRVEPLLVLALVIGSALTQDYFDANIIDPFTVPSDTLIIVVNQSEDVQQTFTNTDTVLGGQRDLELKLIAGQDNLVLSAGVNNGQFSSSAPNGAEGVVLLQYDGADNSLTLNPSGLLGHPGSNFEAFGAFALRVQMEADFTTTATFTAFSGSANNGCIKVVTIPGGDEPVDFILNFDSFDNIGNGCSWENIGAFELEVDLGNNVDVIIRQLSTWAPFVYGGCICPPCPEFSCVMVFDNDNEMIYYVTSDLDDDDNIQPTPSPRPSATNVPVDGDDDDDDDDAGYTPTTVDQAEYSSGSSNQDCNMGAPSHSPPALISAVLAIGASTLFLLSIL